MKSVITLVMIFSFSLAGLSQGVFTNDVNAALQKVIQDYPNNFVNLKGTPVPARTGNNQYHSIVEVPGSLNCILTQYRAAKKEIYSWKCIMIESEKFGEAKNKFTELYNQISNTIVKIEGEKPFILSGKYETPSDDKKFTSVIFQLLPATADMQKLKVELSLQQYSSDWKVALAVYE
jgi:hypothetical protein